MGRVEQPHFGLQEALRRKAFVTSNVKFLLKDLNARSFNQKTDPVFHKF
jgi:hypothetical protein